MRIALIGSYADSLINFRGDLIREMVNRGHEVYAFSPGASERIKSQLADLGCIYINITLNRVGLNPFSDVRFYFELKSLLKKINPNYILAYTVKPVIFGSIAAKSLRINNVFSLVSGLGYSFTFTSWKSKLLGVLVSELYSFALKNNNKVFFQNPDDAQFFVGKGIVSNNQIVLINGSGVNLNEFSRAEYPRDISFLLIARLLVDKGVYDFVEAAREIKGRFPHVKFQLAGWLDDNPRAILKKDLDEWQDSGVIEFLGKLGDVRPALSAASVFVLPSYYREGTPRTILEAMAMGRAIITTDSPGCRETVVNGENGFLVETRNPKQLVEKMLRFIEQEDLIKSMGNKSYILAKDKYDVEKVNTVILDEMEL